jgi:succinylglutamate desuccinylase
MNNQKLISTDLFNSFLETADCLEFFISLHQLKDISSFNEHSYFERPISLNDFFPHSKVNINLVDLGVIEVAPRIDDQNFSQVFLFSAGLHGNETAPIEILRDLLKDLLLGNKSVSTTLLVQFGHFEAMIAQRRQIEENLNRCFDPLKALLYNARSQESIRAFRLQKTLHDWYKNYPQAKFIHFDLHTAIRLSLHKRFCVIPHRQQDRALDFDLIQSLAKMQIEAALFSESASSTYSYYTYQLYDAQSFTIELGSVRPFGQNNHTDFQAAREELSRLIETAQFAPSMIENTIKFYDVVRVIKRTHEDFKLLFAEDIPNFTSFKERTPLAQDGDRVHTSHHDEERVVFPNSKVAIGERACLIVRPEMIKPAR